jgi:hypothetical protein
MSISHSRTLEHVLQIFSKHSKFYQYESCAEFCGTQFIFRLALQILSGRNSNLQVKQLFTIHLSHTNLQIGIQISGSIQTKFMFGLCHCLEG